MLSLEGCDNLTDISMMTVAALVHLRILSLKNCVKLTDRGMAHLCGQMEGPGEEEDAYDDDNTEEKEEDQDAVSIYCDTSNRGEPSSSSTRRWRSSGSPPTPSTFVQSTVQRLSPSPLVSRKSRSSHQHHNTSSTTNNAPTTIDHLIVCPPIECLDVSGCIDITEYGLSMITSSLGATLTSLTLGGCSRVATIENVSLRALARRWQPSPSSLLSPLAPRLKVLDLSGCTRVTNAGLLELSSLASLECLMLWNCLSLTSEGLQVLENLRGLTELSLRGCQQLSDLMFEHIGYLNRLERLDLRTCERITGENGFSSLFTLKRLKYLNLRGCYGITDAGLVQLKEAHLADVEVLNLQDCWQTTATGLAHLSTMTALRDLNLSGCRNLVCAEALPGIGALDQLTSLCLKNCERLRDGCLDSLTSLQQLVHLDISGCRELTGAGLAPLAQLNNNSLETLRMQHCIGLRGPNCLVHLAALNKLTLLHLGGCDNMVGTALRDLGRSSRRTTGTGTGGGHRDRNKQQEGQYYDGIALKSLNLEGCRNVPLLDRGVAALAGSGGAGQLTYLSLAGCTALTDAGLAVLGKFGALKQLNLSDCVQIDGTGFGSWANLHHSVEKEENDSRCGLENLQLQGCIGISDQGLEAVAQLKSLRELNLKHCKHAGDDGLQALAASLFQLTSLSLQGMAGVTNKGVGHLSTMTSLRELELQFCWQFSEDALCQLTGCNQLSYLNLMYSWQGVTDAALETLISGMPCLVSLNVLGCHRLSARAKADAAHLLEWV